LGVFGIPTFVLDGELFWGGDRIALLKERLREI
jgi:2-hydroxychromene-2-carboxylate isomerase